jgi:hypothetical protein
MSFVLLFGVALFSYILGNLIEIINKLRTFNMDLDQDEELELFLGMLKRFNDAEPLNYEFRKKTYEFFIYKWE